MNRTRATLFLAAVSLLSLGATGCHRHRVARGYYATTAYQPVVYQRMAAPQPIVIVVETHGQGPAEVVYNQDNADQEAAREAAVREAAAREEAERKARIERERARIERERAERARREAERARREQEQRDAQARAAAQGGTTIIVLSPGQKPVQVDGSWFQGQE